MPQQQLAIVGIVLWGMIAIALSVMAIRWQSKREARHRARAYEEILNERGVSRHPGESVKAALVRARAVESMRPGIERVDVPSIRIPAPSRPGFTTASKLRQG